MTVIDEAAVASDPPQAPLRRASEVMRLARLGSSFPTRLSFMRSLMRLLAAEQPVVDRSVWEIDDLGFGRAVYTVALSGHHYSLVAFSTPLNPTDRTDRVIAEAWDSSYVLFDGVPTSVDLDRLEAAVPKQEAGRYRSSDLTLSRATRSVRLFNHVVNRLAEGRQPDEQMLASVGYLMRTTAVYGNGKFGIADRTNFSNRPGMAAPFRAEMLTVWLIRGFTLDLVGHIARRRSPGTFVPLDRRLERHLGIGNATGLGMAPFLVTHPILLNNWLMAREAALARVRAVEHPDAESILRFRKLVDRARRHVAQWRVDDVVQSRRIATLETELADLDATVHASWLDRPFPWDRLVIESRRWSLETQELIVALVIEPHGDLVDELSDDMASRTVPHIDPKMTVATLREQVSEVFGWALDIDFEDETESSQFWYVSEEKLEPRLGRRYEEPGAELEQPLDVARRVQQLAGSLNRTDPACSVASFLAHHPEHRFAVVRVQTAARCPYSELRDNLIGDGCLPIDMLRAKLSFFGASKFDPKSDRWIRITLYQGAPLFDDIADPDAGFAADDWWLPVLESA